jgi:hypothetical protein
MPGNNDRPLSIFPFTIGKRAGKAVMILTTAAFNFHPSLLLLWRCPEGPYGEKVGTSQWRNRYNLPVIVGIGKQAVIEISRAYYVGNLGQGRGTIDPDIEQIVIRTAIRPFQLYVAVRDASSTIQRERA